MDIQLTLKLNKQTIDKAKKYAVNQNRSLSQIVEDYLTTLTLQKTDSNKDDIVISPFVKSLSSGISVPPDLDYKTLYSNYSVEKHK